MADFLTAKRRTDKNEGFYVNDPADAGGETLYGVARKKNPNWAGWAIVDSYKGKKDFPNVLKTNARLRELADALYKQQYWDTIWGDRINNQDVANNLYDFAVNAGVSTSIKISQRQFNLPETGAMSEELLIKLNTVV
jgi:lysozyme family protein